MDILIPVVITVVSGLLLGLLLAVLSKVFAVKTDERVETVRGFLPGANCGGCGYAGCEDFAKAIVSGEVSASGCAVGGEEAYKNICSFLGIEGDSLEPKKAFIHCGGCIDYTQDKMFYSGIKSCAAANMFFQGKGKCDFGCLGLGDCAAVCPFGAISVVNDLAVFDRTKCTGCGKCVNTCPNKLISLIPVSRKVAVACSNTEKGALTRKACTHGCIGCMKCEKNCPAGAIKIENGFLASIDYEKCTDCGICTTACPTGAVTLIKNKCSV
ncbi:MAG: RnfABCDGE type electron transport complex subunit B [Acutalibacteraceae bacterium]